MKKLLGFPLLFIAGAVSSQATNKFDSTGNVGVGTVSPGYPLEVVKNTDGAAFVSFSNSTNGSDAYAGYRVSGYNQSAYLIASSNAHSRPYPGFHSGAVQLLSRAYNGFNIISTKGVDNAGPNTGYIRFITSTNEVSSSYDGNDAYTRMVITPSGDVGVGTLNPSQKMDIQGWLRVQGNGSSNRENSGGIDFYNYVTPSSNVQAQIKGMRGLNDWKAGQLGFFTATAATGTLSERMTITENGSVGIGTSAPQGIFHTKSMDYGAVFQTTDDNSRMQQFFWNSTGTQIGKIGTNFDGTGEVTVDFAAGSGTMAQLSIRPSGNVGIGTSAPTERLSVDGNVKANGIITGKKVIVSQSAWPDYVFHESYTLKPLSELAKFIATNKHLPDIPSAKEVEEKGISVGDNQALLLKKIEELTLYVIELKKENQQQSQRIQKLEKKQTKTR